MYTRFKSRQPIDWRLKCLSSTLLDFITRWCQYEMRMIELGASSHTQHHTATTCSRVLSILRFGIHHCYRTVVCRLVDVRACRCTFACECMCEGKKLSWVEPSRVVTIRVSTQGWRNSSISSISIRTNNLCVCVSDVRTFYYYYYFCLIQAFVIFCLAYSIRISPLNVPISRLYMQQATKTHREEEEEEERVEERERWEIKIKEKRKAYGYMDISISVRHDSRTNREHSLVMHSK